MCCPKLHNFSEQPPFGGIYVGADRDRSIGIDIEIVRNTNMKQQEIFSDSDEITENPVSTVSLSRSKQSAMVEAMVKDSLPLSFDGTELDTKHSQNQVLRGTKCNENRSIHAQVHSQTIKTVKRSSLDLKLCEKQPMKDIKNSEDKNKGASNIQNRAALTNLDKIDRIGESSYSDDEAVPKLNPLQEEHGSNSWLDDVSNEEKDDYKKSKEHQSVIKAVLMNLFYFAFMAIVFGISLIISKDNMNYFAIIVMGSMVSLYRTFAPIMSSVYCFEVIRVFWFNYLNEKREEFRDAYNTFRNLWR